MGRRSAHTVDFMDDTLEIYQLTVAQIREVQKIFKNKPSVEGMSEEEALVADEDSGMDLLLFVVNAGVEGGSDMTLTDLQDYPLDALTRLVNDVIEFSGVTKGK